MAEPEKGDEGGLMSPGGPRSPMSNPEREAEGTHLATQMPQIEAPLRIEPPSWMKAPIRDEVETLDAQIRRTKYSPRAQAGTQKGGTRIALMAASAGELSRYAVLAKSAERADTVETEAVAHFAVGVLRDNAGQYALARKAYGSFLKAARRLEDPRLIGLAHNCLGVDAMYLACPPSEHIVFQSSSKLEQALHDHAQHLETAADDGGKFVAATNLGLCRGALGDALTAARHHQDALRFAIALQSSSGQAVAVGNLGALALKSQDYDTAKPCLEQHLRLVTALDDVDAKLRALLLLGDTAAKTLDHQAALDRYAAAAELAKQSNKLGLLKQAHCAIGTSKAALTLPSHFANLKAALSSGGPLVSSSPSSSGVVVVPPASEQEASLS